MFLTVLYNDWNREFFEAIQDKDFESFGPLLLRFAVLAAVFIVGAVYRRYLTQMLQMRWRIWLTRQFLDQLARQPRLLPPGDRTSAAPTTRTSASPKTCACSPSTRWAWRSGCCRRW